MNAKTNKILQIFSEEFYYFGNRVYDLKNLLNLSIENTKIYSQINRNSNSSNNAAKIIILKNKSQKTANEEKSNNPILLNFASGSNPGGGFLNKGNGQEEDICRSSGLYFCLNQDRIKNSDFYKNKKTGKYTDLVIYSSNVPFININKFGIFEDVFLCNVISCAAPNANKIKNNKIIKEIIETRWKLILDCCEINNHKILILGSWGCGIFGNDPKLVFSAFKDILNKGRYNFDKIYFPILDENIVEIAEKVLICR